MHYKAKQRIEDAKTAQQVETPALFAYLSDSPDVYGTLKNVFIKLCDDSLESDELTEEQSQAVVSIRARVIIEL